MATFGELKQKASARIQDKLNTAVSTPEVGDAINAAVKYWKKTGFWFNQGSATVTLVVGNNTLPDTGLFSIRDMVLSYQQRTYPLRALDKLIYDSVNDQSRGQPYGYVWDGGWKLFYYPDFAYTVTAFGLKQYAPLVNDNDTNDFTEYADQMILYDALSRLQAEFNTDPAMSEYYSNRARDEKNELMKETVNRALTGRTLTYETVYTNTYEGEYYAC